MDERTVEFERLLGEVMKSLKAEEQSSIYSADSFSDVDTDSDDFVDESRQYNSTSHVTDSVHLVPVKEETRTVDEKSQVVDSDFDFEYDEDDFPRWPNGDMCKSYQTKPKNWRKNGWAFRQSEMKWSCRGVIVCSNAQCTSTVRPAINNVIYSRQRSNMENLQHLEERCIVETCEGCQILQSDCKARCSYEYDHKTYTFKHYGIHNHRKPIAKNIHGNRNRKISRIGTQYPEKLKSDRPILHNTCVDGVNHSNVDSASYPQNCNIGLDETESKSILSPTEDDGDEDEDAWPDMFDALLPEWDYVELRWVNKTTAYSFRKKCMERWLLDVIDIGDLYQKNGYTGMCTDVNSTFLQTNTCYLISSVLYDPRHLRWVPYQLTITYSHSVEAYKFHFFLVFNSVFDMLRGTAKGQSRLDIVHHLTRTTVDRSPYQKEGFILGYIEFRRSLMGSAAIDNMFEEDYAELENEWRDVALGLLRGCRGHFSRSVVQVAQNRMFVRIAEKEQFIEQCEALANEEDVKVAKAGIQSIYKRWPQSKRWLNWWLVPSRRDMIFDSYQFRQKASDQDEPPFSIASYDELLSYQDFVRLGENCSMLQGLKALSRYVDKH